MGGVRVHTEGSEEGQVAIDDLRLRKWWKLACSKRFGFYLRFAAHYKLSVLICLIVTD